MLCLLHIIYGIIEDGYKSCVKIGFEMNRGSHPCESVPWGRSVALGWNKTRKTWEVFLLSHKLYAM
jgi:hypothetical protein